MTGCLAFGSRSMKSAKGRKAAKPLQAEGTAWVQALKHGELDLFEVSPGLMWWAVGRQEGERRGAEKAKPNSPPYSWG